MNTIIYNTQTGQILAHCVPGQDVDAVKSNWTDLPIETLPVQDGFNLVDAIHRVQWRIDPQTRQLIKD
jgi:hypothetical protein